MSNFDGPPNWSALTAYEAGYNMVKTTNYYYLCTTSGTSASVAPTWPTTFGNTVTDGSIVWTCVAHARRTWRSSTAYVPQPLNTPYPWPDQIVTGGAGSPVVQCILGGTSGVTEPAWSTTLGATTYDSFGSAPGGVTWATVGYA